MEKKEMKGTLGTWLYKKCSEIYRFDSKTNKTIKL